MIELNSIFNQIPEIINADYYWGIIRDGLFDPDNYCRKVSMAVLKNNLKSLGQESIYKGILTQQEFETHWTTFFDLYDTLESFGSHLTKVSISLRILSDQLGCLGTHRSLLLVHLEEL